MGGASSSLLLLCVVIYVSTAFKLMPPRVLSSSSCAMAQPTDGQGLSPEYNTRDLKSIENSPVNQGLTHIKNNKYAPPSDLAATMTPEEFKLYIYKAMKEAERVRRSEQRGQWGSAVSDSYIESLSPRRNES